MGSSIRSAISSPAKPTSRDALPHWPNGAPSRLECRLRVGVSRHALTTRRYSDTSHLFEAPGAARRSWLFQRQALCSQETFPWLYSMERVEPCLPSSEQSPKQGLSS